MRQFTPEYLRETRRGLWDDRSPLGPVVRGDPERILDVGAGTGEFTAVLREESTAQVLALDADRELLQAGAMPDAFQGAATQLPFSDDTVDLAACQALLVNVPDPRAVLGEFTRVASDRIAAVEPDNGEVTVESTVEEEPRLSNRARSYYMAGLETDSRLGRDLRALFEAAGSTEITVSRMVHERVVEPPYSAAAIESARRKVTASRLDGHRETMLDGGLTSAEFGRFRDEWQSMGRSIVEQVQSETYRRRETVPFYVAVGHVG
ncbi:MAG: methyltransferase domain-containing protein [Halodesulfurarchaeum sp.]|nr:methyltransferase domain-containing protein [Halodesulfurarchaeum sp.]